MYDEFAEERLKQLPGLADTDWEECRRRLSRLYFAMIQIRLNGPVLGDSHQAVVEVCDYLRRLANAIEQYLFSEPRQEDQEGLKRSRSYAFIAAEAIDLWCGFIKVMKPETPPGTEIAYARIESSLLYLASDFQINAHCSVAEINDLHFLDIYDPEQRDRDIVNYLQKLIICLTTGNLKNIPLVPDVDYDQYDSIVASRIAAMLCIGDYITRYINWLTGDSDENGAERGLLQLLDQIKPTSTALSGGQFSDLFHLCTLLVHVVRASEPLALMHNLPRPEVNEKAKNSYERYLASRASQRPFLWPSAKDYVDKAFPGPHSDAVVVVPTGSGKSFLAELACSQAMQTGWVLYLAPTNALVNQIQRDLRSAFRTFDEAQIISFIGGQEYTSLAGELLEAPPDLSVAVMTPEKCGLALRVNPSVFQNCRLCIVDEFHTINDTSRGMTLDLCLAQALTLNSETRILLMSAMVSNGDDISDWLSGLRDGRNVPLVQVPWRPCRTLRSLLIVERETAEANFGEARTKLNKLPAKRKQMKFNSSLALLGGMRLQWESEGIAEDYVSIPVPLTFEGKANRGTRKMLHGGADWGGWKNTVGRQVAEIFHEKGSSVLCFILTSRHHVFSSADKCELDLNVAITPHVEALLNLATAELGLPTKVGELLQRGVGVHSSAMLDTERSAVESCFGNRSIGLLFATPTLAQGLNLPADIVVVAGSSLGGARQSEEDRMEGVRSSDATILNAFGRAGRAMVANHGLAVLVSDSPFVGPITEAIQVKPIVESYNLLGGTDRCVQVESPIATFIERLSPDVPLDAFTVDELDLVAQLGECREQNKEVLAHTFGAYLAHRRQENLSLEEAVGRINDIGTNLVQEYDMPEWLPIAAMKSGVDLLTCWRLWQSLNDSTDELEDLKTTSLEDCLRLFVTVMSRLPPKDIRKILPENVRKMDTVLDRMLACVGEDEYAAEWEVTDEWTNLWDELSQLIWRYMSGRTYADMAAFFLRIDPERINNKRNQGQNHIPAIFSFVGKALHHLSIYAGALLVILEESDVLDGDTGQMPLLPLAVRNGCNSSDSMAWFRHGYRNRIAAQDFASIFPVPDELQDDPDVKQWIVLQRKNWLEVDPTEIDSDALQSVWTIMNS